MGLGSFVNINIFVIKYYFFFSLFIFSIFSKLLNQNLHKFQDPKKFVFWISGFGVSTKGILCSFEWSEGLVYLLKYKKNLHLFLKFYLKHQVRNIVNELLPDPGV